MIAGYACRPCFSPDQSYLCSGDGEGKMFIWDWKNGRLYSRFRAHDQVVIDCKWLPHETSKENFNNIYIQHITEVSRNTPRYYSLKYGICKIDVLK